MKDAQERVQLVGTLFRVGVGRVAAALTPAKPAAATKEVLLAAIERAVWALPEDSMAGVDAEDALLLPEVKALLDRAVMEAVVRQPR